MENLKSMDDAPKDGTRIIIFWYDKDMDNRNYNVREAWWWKPTELHQWESGARPHWEYINDRDFCMPIKEPLGWLEKIDLHKD